MKASELPDDYGKDVGFVPLPLHITMTKDTIVVVVGAIDSPLRSVYNLDGSETENPTGSRRGRLARATAHWDGDRFVTVAVMGPPGSATRTETYSIRPDGKLLVEIDSSYSGKLRWVYARQKPAAR